MVTLVIASLLLDLTRFNKSEKENDLKKEVTDIDIKCSEVTTGRAKIIMYLYRG